MESPSTPSPSKLFVDADLRGTRFIRSDLSGVVMRAVEVSGAEIDAPWLLDGENTLFVNGVDVAPLVDAELNRRFPGRAHRRAENLAGVRSAWAAVAQTWTATVQRVASMPYDVTNVSVDGEWSFAQTLRHLVMATDTWLGRAILEQEQPYHPVGLPNAEYAADGNDMSIFNTNTPTYTEVLDARAGRVALVWGFLESCEEADLAGQRRNPWAPQYSETVLSCLHTILEEEWEHHRYAVRDLDAIATGPTTD